VQLRTLRTLNLLGNQPREVLKELSGLKQVGFLFLRNNQLLSLPASLGQLKHVKTLELENNPHLQHPPPEVVARGTEAILAYLRAAGRRVRSLARPTHAVAVAELAEKRRSI
jgi:hypothetical protein